MDLLKNNIAELKSCFKILNRQPNFQMNSFTRTSKRDIFDFYGSTKAQQACAHQVKLFFKQPTHLSLHYSDVPDSPFLHQQFITKTNAIARNLDWNPKTKPTRATLVVLGAGAGFQITELMKEIDYHSIIIIEPDINVLNLLANNLDLKGLREEHEEQRGVYFITSNSYSDFKSDFKNILHTHGFSLLSDISLFRHYNTELFDEIYDSFKVWRSEMASMWGFFEDELISIRHTAENLKITDIGNHLPFDHTITKNTPVIVGNGPSLDDDMHLLKQYSNDLLIVSCGTSLTTLLNNNIVPDIHVEMERTLSNYTIKANALHDPRLSNTILVGLNTLAPQLLKCFNHHILFAKAHDAGTVLLNNISPITPLFHCNPTVTNMAASALCRLGFKEQILLGCDYGYVDHQNHHSASSDYFNPQSQLSEVKFSTELKVEGNFTAHVYSNRIFNEAKRSVENLLTTQKELTIYNCSNGAKIIGAVPIRFKDKLTGATNFYNKRKQISTLCSAMNKRTSVKLKFRVSKNTHNLLGKMIENIEQCISTNELLEALNHTVREVSVTSSMSKYLLIGSIKYMSTTISGHMNHMPSKKTPNYFNEIQALVICVLNHYLTQLNIKENYEI